MKTRQDLNKLSSEELIDLVLQQQEQLAIAALRVPSASAVEESRDTPSRVATPSTESQSHRHRHHHRPWYRRMIDRVLPRTSLLRKYWAIVLSMLVLAVLLGVALVIRAM